MILTHAPSPKKIQENTLETISRELRYYFSATLECDGKQLPCNHKQPEERYQSWRNTHTKPEYEFCSLSMTQSIGCIEKQTDQVFLEIQNHLKLTHNWKTKNLILPCFPSCEHFFYITESEQYCYFRHSPGHRLRI